MVAAAVFARTADERARVGVGAAHLVRDGRSAQRAERRRRGSILLVVGMERREGSRVSPVRLRRLEVFGGWWACGLGFGDLWLLVDG